MADHMRVEVAALAGIDLHRRRAGRADAFGVAAGLLVALDDGDRQLSLQRLDGTAEQAGLSRTGAGDQIEREDPLLVETRRRLAAAKPSFLARMSRSICTSRDGVVADACAAYRGMAHGHAGYRAGGHARHAVFVAMGLLACRQHGDAPWPPSAVTAL
jgi:hypothetical protein